MAIDWDPHSPSKLGVDLLDMGYGHMAINAPNIIGVQKFLVTRTGQLDDVQFFAGTSGALSPVLDSRYNDLRRPMIVDLVPHGSEVAGAVSSVQYEVSTITGGPGMINENFSTPISANRLQTTNDGLFIASGSVGATFNCNFASGAFPLTNHVIGVEVTMRINLSTGVRRIDPIGVAGSPWFYNIPAFSSTFVPATLRMGEAIVEGSDVVWSHWTADMIREFATTRGIRISCQAGPGYWRMDRLALKVYYIPERRRGVGIGHPINNTWVNFDLTTVNATGSPSVTVGEEMSWLIRRINDYSVDSVATQTAMPWRVFRGRAPVYDEWQRLNATTLVPFPDGIGTVRTLDNGVVEDDSVPYSLSRGARVFDGQTASQRINVPAGSTVYGQVYAVAGWIPSDGFPTRPLRCEVYRSSDGVRVFEPVEITADDASRLPVSAPYSNVDDVGAVYKTLRFRFDESTDLSTGIHEVRFSSPDNPESRPWHIGFLLGTTHVDDQTFGGTTEAASGFFLLGTESTALTGSGYTADLLVQLVEVPAAVTGVATAEGSLTVHHASVCDVNRGCDGCADEVLPFVSLTWSAAPTGSPAVIGYHVDRQDDLSPDWERVAVIWGRTNTSWQDHEARIGVQSRYRVRVIREDDVTGDWSSTASITLPEGQIALTFTSNSATGMGCVYPEIWDGTVVRAWAFEETQDITLSAIYGRDKFIAMRPIERKGDSWTRTLLLSAMCTVALPTMNVFQPLRDISWAAVPYVCVRDGEGNRWYATLRVTNGRVEAVQGMAGDIWTADLDVIEVAAVPAIFDSNTSPVDGVASITSIL